MGIEWMVDGTTLYICGTDDSGSRIGHPSPWDSDKRISKAVIVHGVSSIGDFAFYGCSSLRSIEISDDVTDISEAAFCNSSIEHIGVSENNDHFCSVDGVLYDRKRITLIGYPIGRDCTDYEIPAGVEYIGPNAFEWSRLRSVTIPDTVIGIGDWAFDECTSLGSIDIPDSVRTIGTRAFCNCSSLEYVSIPESVYGIGKGAFAGCSSLNEISVSDDSSYYRSVNGILFDREMTELIRYPAGKGDTSYIIPDSVRKIDQCAFDCCSSLGTVTIPFSVNEIGDWCFNNCSSLTSLVIPDSVSNIGTDAFPESTVLSMNSTNGTDYVGRISSNYKVVFTERGS